VIVVDANILAYLFIPGSRTAAARALLAGDTRWAAPVLWRSEMRNVLAGYMRRADLLAEEAKAIQSEAEEFMEGSDYEVDSASVLDLVERSACSSYDCEYVALARQLGVKLVTMDRKVLVAFPEAATPLP
jgi:predicted nucleic acid-binding protein